ncbi:hypothetical protein KQX54_020492 [Cotesia glomerata]|uniref:Uncharacterized protein n=1 Tax=Cotesia glomerata TaxID=32391 RepID=A0AAV7J810_COTGL|nr:hypothetical protein KQX54_020492 [Cotesia glomerata]
MLPEINGIEPMSGKIRGDHREMNRKMKKRGAVDLQRGSICGVRTAVERCKKKKDTKLRKYCSSRTSTLSLIDKEGCCDRNTSGRGIVLPRIKVTAAYTSVTLKFTTGQLDHRSVVTATATVTVTITINTTTTTTGAYTSGISGDRGVGVGETSEGESRDHRSSGKYIQVYPLCKYR